jgi:hypothetical protein
MQEIDEETELQNEVAEETEAQPQEQPPPEPPKSLGIAKEELAAALKKFKSRGGDLESNEKRLAEAEKEERDLLEASMDEEEQVEKLSKIVALQRVLEKKVEHGCNAMESAEAELQYATNEAFRSFDRELSDLRSAREGRHLAALKKLVHDEKWPWAQPHAMSFVRFTADLAALEWLGYQARQLLGNGAVQDAAENLLMDIAKLEAEKGGEKTGKR